MMASIYINITYIGKYEIETATNHWIGCNLANCDSAFKSFNKTQKCFVPKSTRLVLNQRHKTAVTNAQCRHHYQRIK